MIWHLIHVRQGKTRTNAPNTATAPTLHSGSPAAVCRHTSMTSYIPLFLSWIVKTIARPLQGERERKCLSIAGSENRDKDMQLQYAERVGQEQVVASSPSCCQVPQQKCQATRNRKQLMLLVLPFIHEGERTQTVHCLASNTPVPLHKTHPYTIYLYFPMLKMTTPMNTTSLENDKSQIREACPRPQYQNIRCNLLWFSE